MFRTTRCYAAVLVCLVPLATQGQDRSVRDSTALLLKQLAVQHAEFKGRPAIGDFTGNKAPFDALLALYEQAGEPVLLALTDCFTDPHRTSVRYKGKLLTRGGLCYLMVHNLVYHEDDDDNWPGNYFGPLSPEKLLAAQRAWRTIIREHAYDSA
jgi:hypothetical protein